MLKGIRFTNLFNESDMLEANWLICLVDKSIRSV